MMMWAWSFALAGEVYVGGNAGPLGMFDGRELTYYQWWQVFDLPFGFGVSWSSTFHRREENLYTCYIYDDNFNSEYRYMYWSTDGRAHHVGICGVVGPQPFLTTYYNPHTMTIEVAETYPHREWIDPLDMAVGWNGAALDGRLADGTIVPIDNSIIFSHIDHVSSVAWDGDTNLIWIFGQSGLVRKNLALEPNRYRVVADLRGTISAISVATGYRDTTPTQTPELLVTGECPGTVYVTVVDGTPGGRATVASGTAEGASVSPSGPCAGTTSGLADPLRQSSLRVNPYGIASTTFEATPDQCGLLKLQAVDVATCLTTAVRTVPATP